MIETSKIRDIIIMVHQNSKVDHEEALRLWRDEKNVENSMYG